MLGKSISKNSLILGAFAAITAGLIASTFLGTKDRISAAERQAAQKALFEVVPQERHDNDLLNNTLQLSAQQQEQLHLAEDEKIHIAEYEDKTVAWVIPVVAPDGYSGDIKLIVGVNADGTVAGVRVLRHKETPGLGDQIELNKSDWILEFNGKSLDNPTADQWAVKKDGGEFDQFTGATITPRAVVKAVKTALQFYRAQNTAHQEAKP